MIAASFSVQVVAGWIFSRAYDRLALVTSFLAFATSYLFSLVDKDENNKTDSLPDNLVLSTELTM